MDKVTYSGADTSTRGPSHSIWHDCKWLEMQMDPTLGYTMFDDFVSYDEVATGVAGAHGVALETATGTVTGLSGVGGLLKLFSTADNDEAGLEHGGGVCAPFMISDTAGSDKKLWFEARLKKSLVTNFDSLFVGLVSEGAIVANFIATGDTDIADIDCLGFVTWAADGDAIDVIYQLTGAAFSTPISGIGVPVLDTYFKVGFKYDPTEIAAKRIKCFYNGAESSTYVTEALIAASPFPDGEEMTPAIYLRGNDAADKTVTLDWWRCAQEA